VDVDVGDTLVLVDELLDEDELFDVDVLEVEGLDVVVLEDVVLEVDDVVVNDVEVVELELVVVVVGQPTQHGSVGSGTITGAGVMTAEPRMVGGPLRCRSRTWLVAWIVPPMVMRLLA
jgi:hypothetical protein